MSAAPGAKNDELISVDELMDLIPANWGAVAAPATASFAATSLPNGASTEIQRSPRDSAEGTTCWGHLLGSETCTPGFQPKSGPFKWHFCTSCIRQGIRIPATRVRMLAPGSITNQHSHGFWGLLNNAEYRIINQTRKCIGPHIIIFRDATAAESSPFPQLSADTYFQDGLLHVMIAMGTLVPYCLLRSIGTVDRSRQRKRDRHENDHEPMSDVPLEDRSSASLSPSGEDAASLAVPVAFAQPLSLSTAQPPLSLSTTQPLHVSQFASSMAGCEASLARLAAIHTTVSTQVHALLREASAIPNLDEAGEFAPQYHTALVDLVAPLEQVSSPSVLHHPLA